MAFAPAVMAYAPMALAAVGTVVSYMGAQQQAQAAEDAANYNATMNNRNAEIAAQNAKLAQQQAVAQSEAQRRAAYKQLGGMRAGYAASGVQMEGTPLDVMASSVAQSEMDTLNTIYQGQLKGMSYQNEATGLSLSAQLDQSRAASARTSGMYSAGSSLLSGADKVYSAYSKL